MFDISSVIPGKKKINHTGWHSFNAICCHHRGHKADRRKRGGLKFENQYSWRYHCFNCNYACGWTLGQRFSQKTRELLIWCGVDEEQIQAWNIESLKSRELAEALVGKREYTRREYPPVKLPEGARLIEATDTWAVEYLNQRAVDYRSYPYMITPEDEGRNANRIVIPYTYENRIVGYTSRYCDNRTPKYINQQPTGFVFGLDLQKPDWSVCILVEGIFDALSVMGCAYMHNTISREQAQLIANLNRRIIVCPDQDKAGLAVTDRALELGYHVSIPEWDAGVKDVNDAVVRYGALATVCSILEAATASRIKIDMRKRQLND